MATRLNEDGSILWDDGISEYDNELQLIKDIATKYLPNALLQVPAGALELAMSTSPVQYKDGGIEPIIPSALTGIVGMGKMIGEVATGKDYNSKEWLADTAHQQESVNHALGVEAPANVGESILRIAPAFAVAPSQAPSVTSGIGKALGYGLDIVGAPFNWMKSKAVAGVGTALTAGAMEGLDALIDGQEYTSIADVVKGIQQKQQQIEETEFTLETEPMQRYSAANNQLRANTVAKMQEEGDPMALQQEVPNVKPTGRLNITEDGQFEFVSYEEALEQEQFESDEIDNSYYKWIVPAALTLGAGYKAKQFLKDPTVVNSIGAMGKKAPGSMRIDETLSTAKAVGTELKEAAADRFAKSTQLQNVADMTAQQREQLEYMQRIFLNPGAAQAQTRNFLKTGVLADRNGMLNIRLSEAPKRVFDDYAALDPKARDGVRNYLILSNLYHEAANAGATHVNPFTKGGNPVSIQTLRTMMNRAAQNPGVQPIVNRMNKLFNEFIPMIHEHGFIDAKTAADWQANRQWYHPLTTSFENEPDISGNNFVNALFNDLQGGPGRMNTLNQHLLAREGAVGIEFGTFADPVTTAFKYFEALPKVAIHNTWRKNIIDYVKASQDPRVKDLFIKKGKRTKGLAESTYTSIYRNGKKEEWFVADKQVYDMMTMRPETIGALGKTLDAIRRAKQVAITGVARLGGFAQHSAGYESWLIGMTAPSGAYTGAVDQVLHMVGAPSVNKITRGMLADPTMTTPVLNTISVLPIGIARDLYGRTVERFKHTLEFALNNPNSNFGKILQQTSAMTGGVLNGQSLLRRATQAYENSTYRLAQNTGLYHPSMISNPNYYDNSAIMRDVSSALYNTHPRHAGKVGKLLDTVLDSGRIALTPINALLEAAQNGPRLQYLALNYKKGMSQADLRKLMYETKHVLGDTTDSGVSHGSVVGEIGKYARLSMAYYRPGVQAITAMAGAAQRAPTETAMRLATQAMMTIAAIGVMSKMYEDEGWWHYYTNVMTPEDRAIKMPVPRINDAGEVEFVTSNYEPLQSLVVAPIIEVMLAMGDSVGSDQKSMLDMWQNWSMDFIDLEMDDIIAGTASAIGRAGVVSLPVGIHEAAAFAGQKIDLTAPLHSTGKSILRPLYHQPLDPNKGKTYNSVLGEEFENLITEFAGASGYAAVNSLNQLAYDITGDSGTKEPVGPMTALGRAMNRYAIETMDGSWIGRENRVRMMDSITKNVRHRKDMTKFLNDLRLQLIGHPDSMRSGSGQPTLPINVSARLNRTNAPDMAINALTAFGHINDYVGDINEKMTATRIQLDQMYARPEIFLNPTLLRKTENEVTEEFRTQAAEMYNAYDRFEENHLNGYTIEELYNIFKE